MDYGSEDDLSTSYTEYTKAVRERASDSIHLLQRTLDSTPVYLKERRGGRRSPNPGSPHSGNSKLGSPSGSHGRGRRRSPHELGRSSQPWEEIHNVEHSDYSYGAAVSRLRNMLRKHDDHTPRNVRFSESKVYGRVEDAVSYAPPSFHPSPLGMYRGSPAGLSRGEIPTPDECVPLLQNQSVLIQQLEAENTFCKNEFHVLKLKVREVVEENHLLHEELKRSVIQEILQEGIDVPGIPSTLSAAGMTSNSETLTQGQSRQMGKEDWSKWQKELERITALHQAKTSRLETQLQHTKEELCSYEKETESLRRELRMRDSISKSDPELLGLAAGLCIRCATSEAVIQPSGGVSHSLAELTRERDGLMEQLAVLRTRYEELRQREDDMYQQMKLSIEMVEQAHLEETQLIVQRDQLQEELEAMKSRVGKHAEEIMEKMAEERELIRKEFKAEKDELNAKVKELTQSLVETQNELEKTTRDKISLIADLQSTRGQVDLCDTDYSKATDSMKLSMTQATLERNMALGEMTKMKKEFDRMEKEREQERSRIRQELYDARRRLSQAEKELVETKEECIHLTNTTQQLEREMHLAKLARESIEKSRTDDIKNLSQRAQLRESELNMLLDQLEAKHANTVNELENIVGSQSSLVQKLRTECRKVTHQLQDYTVKYRGDNKKLHNQSLQLKSRLERAQTRLRDLEDQHTQHGVIQDKMRQRLREMDEHSGHATQQVVDLLAKESSLMRDRQLLAKEVEFLRRQLLHHNQTEMVQFYSAHKGLVDDILLDMKGRQEALLREVEPQRDADDVDLPVMANELLIGQNPNVADTS